MSCGVRKHRFCTGRTPGRPDAPSNSAKIHPHRRTGRRPRRPTSRIPERPPYNLVGAASSGGPPNSRKAFLRRRRGGRPRPPVPVNLRAVNQRRTGRRPRRPTIQISGKAATFLRRAMREFEGTGRLERRPLRVCFKKCIGNSTRGPAGCPARTETETMFSITTRL